jgi:hypothetical protein
LEELINGMTMNAFCGENNTFILIIKDNQMQNKQTNECIEIRVLE